MTDNECVEHAIKFLSDLNTLDEAQIHNLIDKHMGPNTVEALAYYAEQMTEKFVKNMNDAKTITRVLMLMGYLLRAEENRQTTFAADLKVLAGGLKN